EPEPAQAPRRVGGLRADRHEPGGPRLAPLAQERPQPLQLALEAVARQRAHLDERAGGPGQEQRGDTVPAHPLERQRGRYVRAGGDREQRRAAHGWRDRPRHSGHRPSPGRWLSTGAEPPRGASRRLPERRYAARMADPLAAFSPGTRAWFERAF